MAKLELRLPVKGPPLQIPAKVESPKASPVVEDNSPLEPKFEEDSEVAGLVSTRHSEGAILTPAEPPFWNRLSEAVIEALGRPFCDGPCVCTGDSGTRCGKCPLRGSVNPVTPRPAIRLFTDPYFVHSL